MSDTLDQPVFQEHADLHEFGLRMAYLQFPYSEDQYGAVARLLPMLDRHFSRPPFEIMSREAISDVLGGPLDVFVDSAPFFSAAAIRNGGRFQESWLTGPQFAEIRAEIDLDVLMSVFRHAWASTIPDLRARARSSTSANPLLRPFDWNPLQARPYVQLSDGSHVAPNVWWAHNRVSPTAVYHLGMDRHQESWARDLGRAQEDYLVHQLGQLEPLARVIPEFEYPTRNGSVRTVDAFVIFDDLVVLVESKSVRARLGSTTSADAYRDLLRRDLDKAYGRQLPRSVDLVRADHPKLGGGVSAKPVVALIVTPEPLYQADSPSFISSLPPPPVPTSLIDVSKLEKLVAAARVTRSSDIIAKQAGRGSHDSADMNNAFQAISGGLRLPNPILDEAFAQGRWQSSDET